MRRLRAPACWNVKKTRLLHPSTITISQGVATNKRANSGNARATASSTSGTMATYAATANNAIGGIRLQFRRQPVRALSTRTRTRNRIEGALKLKVLELEAFDRLDNPSDSIDIHTGTRKRKYQKPGTTLYIGDDETKSWKVLAFGKDEGEEQTSSTSDQEPKLKQTASLSLAQSFENLQQKFYDHVIQYFLPAHFPNSVAPGYARFTAFGFCASGTSLTLACMYFTPSRAAKGSHSPKYVPYIHWRRASLS